MIDDLLSGASQLNADVCVIGSGAAGLSFAREFLSGLTRVVVLESGGFTREDQIDSLNRGENVGVPNPGPDEGRIRTFGGTTDLWPGGCTPLTPLDFQERPWVPRSGWPITRSDLEPYYVRAGDLLSVPVAEFRRDVWSVVGVPGPRFDPDLLSHCLTLFSPRPHRFFGRVMRRDFERSSNVRALLHATVTELRTDPSGSNVESVQATALSGRSVTVTAKVFVLCAGGFENARLLLLSTAAETAGVGNRHDLVGRFYQDHPHAKLATIRPRRPALLQEPYGVAFVGFPPRPRPYPKISLSPDLQRREEILNCAATVVWDVKGDSGELALLHLFRALRTSRTPILPRSEIGSILRDLPGTARFVARYVRGRASITPPKSMWLLGGAEQAPNLDSRVTLSDQRDALGSPRVRLDWRLTELDHRTARTMAGAVRDAFRRQGLAEVDLPDWLQPGAEGWTSQVYGPFHPTGTTRMASDPKRGVVDANCRVHGVSNLFVAGSSVFPTSGYANPTFTIIALAIRLADHVRSILR